MTSAFHADAESRWFGTVKADGRIVVDHKFRHLFTVHGHWDLNRPRAALDYTVVTYYPDGWPLKETLYTAAQQFALPFEGKLDHGPYAGAPHTFGVVIPIAAVHSDPRQQFPWLGQCLFNALLAAVELNQTPS